MREMEDTVPEKDYVWYMSPTGPVERNWYNFTLGLIPIEELDDQEIAQIRMKADDGRFRGPKPYVDTKTFRMFKREMHHRFEQRMATMVMEKTLDVMEKILDDPSATAGERMRAAQYLQERTFGKVPDKVEVTAEVKPWEGTVAGILADVSEESDEEKKGIEAG